jgi:hypothetical protein
MKWAGVGWEGWEALAVVAGGWVEACRDRSWWG